MLKRSLVMSLISLPVICFYACVGGQDTGTGPEAVVAAARDGSSITGIIAKIDKQVEEIERKTSDEKPGPGLDRSKEHQFDLSGAPAMGPPDANLTMAAFIDFEGPGSRVFAKTAAELAEKFKDELRVVFMNFPLNSDCNEAVDRRFRKGSCMAAEAGMAAHAEGKYWDVQDKIFESQREISEEKLVEIASQAGMEKQAVEKAIQNNEYKQQIKSQAAQLARTGKRGTPEVFINGVNVENADWSDLEKSAGFIQNLLQEQQESSEVTAALHDPEKLPRAEVVLSDGALLQDKLEDLLQRIEDIEIKAKKKKRRRGPDPEKTYSFNLEKSPAIGAEDAPVTLVEFSDFTCPYCQMLGEKLKKIVEEKPEQVRLVFKNVPNPRHRHSKEAHAAAVAAHMQGKFWEMHDKIFANRRKLSPEFLREAAEEIGLDMEEYDRAIENETYKDYIITDIRDASKIRLTATPTLFINGKYQQNRNPKAILERIENITQDKGE